MAGLGGSAANLALWLHLRGKRQPETIALPTVPEGTSPLLLIQLPPNSDDPPALMPILGALIGQRSDLRLLLLGGQTEMMAGLPRSALRAPAPENPETAAQMLAALSPSAILLIGDDLPAALISAAGQAGIPIILAEARLSSRLKRSFWQDTVTRGLFARIDHILAPDVPAATLARDLGGRSSAIEVTGPVTDTRAPLRGNEAERQVLAQLLSGRHIWLAATPTEPEALAALAAHQAALQFNHRALLIIAGLPPDSVQPIVAAAAELGMAAVLRNDDEDPSSDDQMLIAEEDDELGLWYRLAPVCFMGGTLIDGHGLPSRHPFEPAALGSAIIHGTLPGPFDAEWAQLDGADATRLVADSAGLIKAVVDLAAADQAAILAQNAWNVSTGGAAVVRRIAATVLGAIGAKT